MSRQNKQARNKVIKEQVTRVHKQSVISFGKKRTEQTKEQRHSVPRTTKLTSAKKGKRSGTSTKV